jgi:hypothetical protein
MIDAGSSQIVNTSSGDGSRAGARPRYGVEGRGQLLHRVAPPQPRVRGTALRASVFYPSGGLLRTGLFTAARNRPEHLQRQGAGTGRVSMTFDQLKDMLAKGGRDVTEADLDELGDFVVAESAARRYIIGRNLDASRPAAPAGVPSAVDRSPRTTACPPLRRSRPRRTLRSVWLGRAGTTQGWGSASPQARCRQPSNSARLGGGSTPLHPSPPDRRARRCVATSCA